MDTAPPRDPKGLCGSNTIMHDLRQGLVSPFIHSKPVAREFIPRTTQFSLSADGPLDTLHRLGRISTFRRQSEPKAPRERPCRKRQNLAADGVSQTMAKRHQQSGFSQSAKLERAPTITRSQPLEDTPRDFQPCFPRRRLFHHQSKGDLNALAEATGRLRLEEDDTDSTEPPKCPASVRRLFATLAALRAALGAARRQIDNLKFEVQRMLRLNRTGVEHGPEHALSTRDESTAVSRQEISGVESSLAALESLRRRLAIQEIALRIIRAEEALTEQNRGSIPPIRQWYTAALRREIARAADLQDAMDSMRRGLSSLILALQRRLEPQEAEEPPEDVFEM